MEDESWRPVPPDLASSAAAAGRRGAALRPALASTDRAATVTPVTPPPAAQPVLGPGVRRQFIFQPSALRGSGPTPAAWPLRPTRRRRFYDLQQCRGAWRRSCNAHRPPRTGRSCSRPRAELIAPGTTLSIEQQMARRRLDWSFSSLCLLLRASGSPSVFLSPSPSSLRLRPPVSVQRSVRFIMFIVCPYFFIYMHTFVPNRLFVPFVIPSVRQSVCLSLSCLVCSPLLVRLTSLSLRLSLPFRPSLRSSYCPS